MSNNRNRKPPGGPERREYIEAELAHWGVVRSTDAQGRARYEVTCGECGKHDSKFYPLANNPEDVLKPYRNQGWIFGYHESPFHANGCKRAFERKEKFKRKEEEHPMTTKTPDPPLWDGNKAIDPGIAPVPTATTGDPAIVRRVITLLNDHFDTTKHLYESGWDDARVAKEAKTSMEFVAKCRVTYGYGELAEDPVLTQLRQDVAAAAAMVKEFERRLDELQSRLDRHVGHHKASG